MISQSTWGFKYKYHKNVLKFLKYSAIYNNNNNNNSNNNNIVIISIVSKNIFKLKCNRKKD